MPSPDYYRRQAQIFVGLALASRASAVIARYQALALDYLAKAEEIQPLSAGPRSSAPGDTGSDMDRD